MDEIGKSYNDTQNMLAERISAIIRSINDKEKTIEFFRKMKDRPSIETLNRIIVLALQNEDYETCEVVGVY